MAGRSKKASTASSQKMPMQGTKNNLQKLQINDPVNRNDRIMTALDKLGQKFIESEADRLNMKKSVDDQFNAQKEIDRKVRRNRITTDKIEKALSDAIQENERLRQIVTKSEKRQIRLQKRIERVESIANEAQSALEAKAMVLLTDRALANEVGVPQIPAHGDFNDLELDDVQKMRSAMGLSHTGAAQAQYTTPLISGLVEQPLGEDMKPWWQRRLQMSTATVLGCLALAGLVGWAGTNMFSEPQTQMADTSFAIMQDGQLARINLRTGEITPVTLAAKKAVQEQMSSKPEFKLPSSNTMAKGSDAQSDVMITGDAIPVPTQEKPETTVSSMDKEAIKKLDEAMSVLSDATISDRIEADDALSGELKELEQKAFEGSAEAQHDLAALYTAGQGVKQDYQRASAWFKEAANSRIANASYNLGVLHHQGLGVEQDMPKALNWYRKAALQGHPEAQYNLGIAYIEGVGAKYNPNMASAYFRQASLNGIVEGAYNLGLILENGLLGQAYLEQAMAWYRAAADKGSVDAAQALTALADKLGVDADKAGLLGSDELSLAESMRDLADIQPATGGADAQATLPKVKTEFDLVLADYIPLWDQMMLSEIQTQLADLALYSGAQDGVMGPATAEAIKTYQTIQGQDITGEPSGELLQFMLAKVGLESDEG